MFEHEFLQLVPVYALGALGGAEKRKFEEHLGQGCEICQPELIIFEETVHRLPYALQDQKIPADLKQKLKSRIEKLWEPKAVSRTAVVRIAAIIALVVIAATLTWRQSSLLQQRERQIADLEKKLGKQNQEIGWLRDPSVQLAMLTGLAPAPGAKGKIVWNQAVAKGIFYADSLPPLSSGKSYQLWVIGNKGPVSAGVFDPDQRGAVVLTITRIAGPAEGSLQFAVTIEPRGGLPQPTGAMILAGKAL